MRQVYNAPTPYFSLTVWQLGRKHPATKKGRRPRPRTRKISYSLNQQFFLINSFSNFLTLAFLPSMLHHTFSPSSISSPAELQNQNWNSQLGNSHARQANQGASSNPLSALLWWFINQTSVCSMCKKNFPFLPFLFSEPTSQKIPGEERQSKAPSSSFFQQVSVSFCSQQYLFFLHNQMCFVHASSCEFQLASQFNCQ